MGKSSLLSVCMYIHTYEHMYNRIEGETEMIRLTRSKPSSTVHRFYAMHNCPDSLRVGRRNRLGPGWFTGGR
jgi:hypothetical protein